MATKRTIICSTCRATYETNNNSHYCPPCHAEYAREWYRKNKNSVRDTQFKMKYGITLDEYNEMYIEQEGLCAICNMPQPDGRFKYLAIDHDHEFNYIRALLCTQCNIGLGNFKDDPELLRAAADYIERWQI